MFDATVETFGGLDHIYLNAGVASGIGLGDDFDVDTYRRVMGINLDGVVFGAHEAIRVLREQGWIRRRDRVARRAHRSPLRPSTRRTSTPSSAWPAPRPGLVNEGIRFNAICPGFAESGIIAPIRDALINSGFTIIPAEKVAAGVVALFEGEASGECWFVQPGWDPQSFQFRNIPTARRLTASFRARDGMIRG